MNYNRQLMSAGKDTLVSVNETLKSIAEIHESLARSEERTANMMEMVAENLHQLANLASVNSNALAMPETGRHVSPHPLWRQITRIEAPKSKP